MICVVLTMGRKIHGLDSQVNENLPGTREEGCVFGILLPVLAMRSDADQAPDWIIAKTGKEIPKTHPSSLVQACRRSA